MKVIIFGATGMVGQAVLKQCVLDKDITSILAVGRSSSDIAYPKLSQLAHEDLWNYKSIENDLTGYDACFFCIGTTAAAKSEKDYTHITYDMTLAAATTLARLNPNMTFIYVSAIGAGEQSKQMWARVRGKTENALLALPFKAVYIVRPAVIQPLDGIETKNTVYRLIYMAAKPLLPILFKKFPKYVTTTTQLGRVMINVAKKGAPNKIIESSAFASLA